MRQSPLPIEALERRREAMLLRRSRTIAFGPCMRLQFENRETLHHHVAEILRAERITDPDAVREEAEAYAHLIPDGSNWKATLFIELPNAAERARELPQLNHAIHHLHLEIPGHGRAVAFANEDLADKHQTRPSAVHFLRFQFNARQRAAIWLARQPLRLRCLHSAYPFADDVDIATLERLRADLAYIALPGFEASPSR